MAYGERRSNMTPAVLAAVVLHAVAGFLLWYQWPSAIRTLAGSSVAVTIVSDLPTAPEPAPTPELQETAPPAPDVPEVKPETPPTPAKAAPAAAKPQKTAAQAKAESSASMADLEKLIAKVSQTPTKSAKPGPRKSAGAPHPGPVAAPNPSALGGLVSKVAGLWTIDCDAAGARAAKFKVTFTITAGGGLAGDPKIVNPSGSTVEDRAIGAIKAGRPYSLIEVPSDFRNKPITITFWGEDACRGQ